MADRRSRIGELAPRDEIDPDDLDDRSVVHEAIGQLDRGEAQVAEVVAQAGDPAAVPSLANGRPDRRRRPPLRWGGGRFAEGERHDKTALNAILGEHGIAT